MESNSLSDNTSEPPSSSWAGILGTTIAVLTLTLPVLVIANYSNSNAEPPPRTTYSIPRSR